MTYNGLSRMEIEEKKMYQYRGKFAQSYLASEIKVLILSGRTSTKSHVYLPF